MKMKKQLFLVSVIILMAFFTQGQNLNIEKLGQLPYGEELSDIWAYSTEDSTGVKEYALVGVNNGLSIVDVTNAAEPVELHFIEGIRSSWRDIKTYNGFAYVTNESGGGVLIVDLNKLPDEAPSQNFIVGTDGDGGTTYTTAHNVFIDESGFMYVVGYCQTCGALIYDLNTDPWEPELAGIYDDNYIHDIYVRDSIMYCSEGNRIAVVDVKDKSDWKILGTQQTYGYAHNAWLSDDSKTLFTTDETPGTWIVAWDVSDPADIKETDKVQSSPGEGVIPHNTHVLNDFLITSYYTDGVTIHDASNPNLMIEVGSYDTSPNFSGGGFNGCWGATPFLPSGNILATDIQEGLYILKPTYKRGALLVGLVSDVDTNESVSEVEVNIIDQNAIASTDSIGSYSIGTAGSSTVVVEFSKPGYISQTDTIELVELQTDTLNVSLQAEENFAISLNVFDKDSGEKISGAVINIVNEDFLFSETTNESGDLMIDQFYEGEYYVYIGKWGYQTIGDTINFSENRNSYSANLEKGYYDDFTLDFDWQISGDATTGTWERGEPVGTNYQGSRANPDEDVDSDISNLCYVTGNAGGNAGSDDIDDGSTVLTSPEFNLTNFDAPQINYQRWFFNDGGQGTPPNDMLTIYLSNGIDTVVLETINDQTEGNGSWQQSSFVLTDFDLELNNSMTLIIETADLPEGHLVEAAFDHFYIENEPVGIIDNNFSDLVVQLSENPFTNQIQLTLNDAFQKLNNQLSIQFIAVDGKVLDTKAIVGQNITWGNKVSKGVYQYIISHNKGYLYTGKIIKL